MAIESLNEEAIFNVARKIDSTHGRLEYLNQACGNFRTIHDRVSLLLRLHDQEQNFLESAPPGLEPTIPPPQLMEQPGTRIGPYKLREQIGEGGFGIVYVAEQLRPVARKVAMKIIKPGMATKDVIARLSTSESPRR